jgi:hypothetical protein
MVKSVVVVKADQVAAEDGMLPGPTNSVAAAVSVAACVAFE